MLKSEIRSFQKTTPVPLYTFAYNEALSSAYLLLTLGDEVYAERSSMIGSIGTKYRFYSFNPILKTLGAKVEYVTTNE